MSEQDNQPAWARTDRQEAIYQRGLTGGESDFRAALKVIHRQFERQANDCCDGTLVRMADDFAKLLAAHS